MFTAKAKIAYNACAFIQSGFPMQHPVIPQAYLDKVTPLLGDEATLRTFIDYCQRPLRRSIRVNTLKITLPDFTERAQKQGWQLEAVPWCKEGFWLQRPAEQENLPLGNTAEFLAGMFYIQEASSMLPPVALLAGESGTTDISRVLDMAAAPGSKTTQLSASMNNQGLLVANELSSSRLKVLNASLQRMGAMNVAMSHFEGQVFGQWLPEGFDAVLLDAPCGGEGTVRKDPLALQNWSEAALHKLAAVQKELMDSAFHALRPGGVLVYSTCTLSVEENQQVVNALLNRYPQALVVESLAGLFDGADKAVTPEGYLHVWPQLFDSEGFFVARLRKTQSRLRPERQKRTGKFPYVPAARQQTDEICHYLQRTFGLVLPEQHRLFKRDNDFWLFPSPLLEWMGQFRFDRMGIKLVTAHRQGFRLTHEAAIALGKQAVTGRYELSPEQLESYYQGKDLFVEVPPPQGELLLMFAGCAVGLGKGLNNRIKNSLPRDLVRDGRLVGWV
ncbi:16S rRNA (cytosine(1407)-C(5))-methyltransferase RsmF [Bowmanella dokdonensis]|nr:16S rRNA (cytosine(1407)-C(5))-methyltransferase RsmF [Bowmanella dokdonensis]